MIEAVIWDFGGVLTSSPFEAFARYEIERGLPTDIIRRTNATNHWENAWAKFERAEVDLDAFDNCSRRNRRHSARRFEARMSCHLLSGDLRPEMVEALKRVKAKFKTGCITNNLPANAIGSLGGRSLYIAEVMALFDHVIESAKIGLTKTRSAHLSNDGRGAGRRSQKLRLSRRFRGEPKASPRNGNEDHQGNQCLAGNQRIGGATGLSLRQL